MKISYSIAIILSCALLQLTSATAPEHGDAGALTSQSFGGVKRSVEKRYMATALRRRQTNYASPPLVAPGATPATPAAATSTAPSPAAQVEPILNGISDSIKTILSGFEGKEDGEEETHDKGDRLEAKQQKQTVKLIKKLIKAINDLLEEAGLKDEALDMDGVLKSAEKGNTVAPPPSTSEEGGALEARSLAEFLMPPSAMDRDLTAANTAPTAPENPNPEHDGGDDGSTEGDNQHHSHHPARPPSPQVNTPGAPAAPAKPKNSDGGTDGDEEHHQRHPIPAKRKRSSEPDPKKIKSAAKKVNDALSEFLGAAGAQEEEGGGAGATGLVAQIKQLLAVLDKPQA
ncbi:hypothetical protein BCR42DRAFT_421720 [Absidia repens]|uniref:Uncharacterized protein n=1 Tax=Absidia repens TaxID=90262 RepID=A0A1X2I7R2_9FUNG|nr:hypothetical protein BCR42DRAFT_421720 [Absidia repens]